MRLAVVDGDRVVVAIETVDKSLDRWLIEVSEIGRRLAGFLSEDIGLRIDQSECVDDDFALDRLDWIDNDGDSAGRKLLERLLCVDIDA